MLVGTLIIAIVIVGFIASIPSIRNTENQPTSTVSPSLETVLPTISIQPSTIIPSASPVVDKITVISPNGGEVYVPGDILKITWKAPDILKEIEISISQNCPKGAQASCSSTSDFYQYFRVANSGSFLWLIPSTIPAGSYYSVSISDEFAMNSKFNDSSDGYFEIKKGGLSQEQGELYGKVLLYTGNCMPGASSNAGTSCKIIPVSREIFVRDAITALLIKKIKSASNGEYRVTLPAGFYNIFVEDEGKEYCNIESYSGDRLIKCPVNIKDNISSKYEIMINHAVW